MKTEYQVVEAISVGTLVQRVNEELKNGWQPQGGIYVLLGRNHNFYLQAVIRVTYSPYTINTYTVNAHAVQPLQQETA